MRPTLLIAAAVSTALSTLAWPALAQQNCAPLDQVEAHLAAEYQETRVGQGITASGRAMLMLYASPQGTWTVLMVNPEKIACPAAEGRDWQVRNDAPAVPETGL